jgi:hypothetical protein
MIELRYVIYKNRVTAEKVKAYADEHDIPMALAKKECEDMTDPILQYRQLPVPAIWQNVETVVEYRDE